MVQATVSTQLETHVRSALVRFVTHLNLKPEKRDFHTDENHVTNIK